MLKCMTSIKPSVISGVFASVAVIMGIFAFHIFIAKLAFDASDSSILKSFVNNHFKGFEYSQLIIWILRVIFGLLAIASNAFMLKYYVASLKLNGATKATVYTFSCNFILTVFFQLYKNNRLLQDQFFLVNIYQFVGVLLHAL